MWEVTLSRGCWQGPAGWVNQPLPGFVLALGTRLGCKGTPGWLGMLGCGVITVGIEEQQPCRACEGAKLF